MPHYFFHIRAEGHLIPDEEGLILPDLAGARQEAVCSIRDLMADAGFEVGVSWDEKIEVADASGATVLSVPFFKGAALAS